MSVSSESISLRSAPSEIYMQHSRTRHSSQGLSEKSNKSNLTLPRVADLNFSTSSLGSASARHRQPLRVINTNVSQTLIACPIDNATSHRKVSKQDKALSRNVPSNHHSIDVVDSGTLMRAEDGGTSLEEVDLQSTRGTPDVESFRTASKRTGPPKDAVHESDASPQDNSTSTIKRLFDSVRPVRASHTHTLSESAIRWSLDDTDEQTLPHTRSRAKSLPSGHQKSSSWSSTDFVTTIRSAATGFRPTKFGHRIHKIGDRLGGTKSDTDNDIMLNDMNSRSFSENTETTTENKGEQVFACSKIITELMETEEGYINDLKILAHVYFTILASVPDFPQAVKEDVEYTLGEMLLLHTELLEKIKLCHTSTGGVPKTEAVSRRSSTTSRDKSIVRKSLDTIWHRSPKQTPSSSLCSTAQKVAGIFQDLIVRFAIYEEYGARYMSMISLVNTASKTIPSWLAYERGIEALVNSILCNKPGNESDKKALTLEDLLIKPVQRVCRYPLIFAELHKYALVNENIATVHEIQATLDGLRDTAEAINIATDDTAVQARFHRLWAFRALVTAAEIPDLRRILSRMGSLRLCGLLYVVYQSHTGIVGSFMLGSTIGPYLLLAKPGDSARNFSASAIINRHDAQISEADCKTGLSCRNTSHTWKLKFQASEKKCEVIMCACTQYEEEQWRAEFSRSQQEPRMSADGGQSLYLSKEFDTWSSEDYSSMHHSAEHPSSASHALPYASEFSIRNSSPAKEDNEQPRRVSMPRKRSSLTTASKMTVFVPDRAERARLEHLMEDVWSKDSLPFPSLPTRKTGSFIRSPKKTVIRRLSRASATSPVSPRTVSSTSSIDPFVEHVENKRGGYSVHVDCDVDTFIGQESSFHTATDTGSPYTRHIKHCEQVGENHITWNLDHKRSRDQSESTVRAADTTDIGVQHAQTKKRSKTLFKALSTDAIRTWFV